MTNPKITNRNAVAWKYPFFEATVDGEPLKSRIIDGGRDTKKLHREFGWGYHGVYPTNLSVSILCDLFDLDDYALLFADVGYGVAANRFYDEVIVPNKLSHFELLEDDLWSYFEKISNEIQE